MIDVTRVRCRDERYEAEVLCTDMGGVYPWLGRVRVKGDLGWQAARWTATGARVNGGCTSPYPHPTDLIEQPDVWRGKVWLYLTERGDEIVSGCEPAYYARLNLSPPVRCMGGPVEVEIQRVKPCA